MTKIVNTNERITTIVNERTQAQRRFDNLRTVNPNCMGAEAFRHLTELKRLEAELAEAEADHLQWLYGRCARFHAQADVLGNICREHDLEAALEPLMKMKRKLDALDQKAPNQGGLEPKKRALLSMFDRRSRN